MIIWHMDMDAGAGTTGAATEKLVITMVFVTVSETYDLSTKANKMTLIGIHTPTKDIIQKTYPGLCLNSKYCRIVKQDVTLACASLMPSPIDALGLGPDDIAPQDLFNPILYKAVSNESMSTLEYRLAGLMQQTGSQLAIDGSQAVVEDDRVTGLNDEFNVYYSLLANRDGFKAANPQQGLTMKGLVPLVFEKYYNYGNNAIAPAEGSGRPDGIPTLTEGLSTPVVKNSMEVQSMRGRAHPMPRFNTTYLTGSTGSTGESSGQEWQSNGMADGFPRNSQVQMPDILPVYTACIIMPPSARHLLFYRMVVRTTLEFSEIRPIQEVASFGQLSYHYAPVVYHSDYTLQSANMSSKLGMVDTDGADINKIMEGA
nr:MAG: capsid protein [ssDNA virus sp.]